MNHLTPGIVPKSVPKSFGYDIEASKTAYKIGRKEGGGRMYFALEMPYTLTSVSRVRIPSSPIYP